MKRGSHRLDAPVHVAVVDDHEMVLEALAEAIDFEDDLVVTGRFTSAAAFLRWAQDATTPVSVVVSDLDLGDDLGTNLVGPAAELLGAPLLLISGTGDRRASTVAAESGCAGFVSKGVALEDLAEAIRIVAAGGTVFPEM